MNNCQDCKYKGYTDDAVLKCTLTQKEVHPQDNCDKFKMDDTLLDKTAKHLIVKDDKKLRKVFLYVILSNSIVFVAAGHGIVPLILVWFVGFIGWPIYLTLFWSSVLLFIVVRSFGIKNIFLNYLPFGGILSSWVYILSVTEMIELTLLTSVLFIASFIYAVQQLIVNTIADDKSIITK